MLHVSLVTPRDLWRGRFAVESSQQRCVVLLRRLEAMGLTESSTYQRGGLADAHSGDRVGYRVLDVVQGSPAAAAGLCQVLDFIVTANGVRLDSEDKRIQDIIAGSENEPLNLGVYNVVTETVRGTPCSAAPIRLSLRSHCIGDATRRYCHSSQMGQARRRAARHGHSL